jgi:hypothetical protein
MIQPQEGYNHNTAKFIPHTRPVAENTKWKLKGKTDRQTDY